MAGWNVDNPAMSSPADEHTRDARGGVLQKSLERLEHDWRSDVKRSLPGVLLSLLVHTCLLLLLAMIVFQVKPESLPEMTDLLWGPNDSDVTDFDFTAFKITSDLQVDPDESSPELASTETMLDVTMPTLDAINPLRVETAMAPSVTIGKVFSGRSSSQQAQRIRESGGDPNATRTIRLALEWIARQQHKDGRWKFHEGFPQPGLSGPCDTGATGMALLTFLGAGSTTSDGDYRREVHQGVKWLVAQQQRNGNLDLGDGSSISRIYSHAIATIALCECYAMTGDEGLKTTCENAIRYLDEAQLRGEGGWRYGVLRPGEMGDLSVTGWALMALQTARVAGMDVPARIFRKSTGFLNKVETQQPWLYSYTPGRGPTLSMTAEGLVCRQWMGWERDEMLMKKGIEYLIRSRHLPSWSEGKRSVYAWYYLAHALHNHGGQTWNDWYAYTQKILMEQQVLAKPTENPGDVVGSWHPHTPRGDSHDYGDRWGRLYVTCLCTLILETPFRHLPLYEMEKK